MTLPAVTISKNVFTTSQAPASTVGILAICAGSSTGTVNTPGSYSRSDLAVSAFGYGPLTDFGAYDISIANAPFLAVKANCTYPGSYGTITKSLLAGSSTVVAGGTAPFDRYNVGVTIVNGGTIGVTGITYTYTLDGGNTTSGIQALGTGTTLTIPNSGVSFTIGAGTLITGATWSVFTERPLMNDTDITNSMTALGVTRLPFEGVLLDCSAGSSTVGLIDTILSGWEGRGIFKFAIINSRMKNEPEPTAEDEATYAAALSATFGTQTSIRVCVGADGAHAPSTITGYNIKRPTSMFLAARAMAIPLGEDPAYVGRGPIKGAQISDSQGNPYDHDEDLYPNLDSLRLTTLRSFAPGGPQGVYICNANTIQPSGGSFPYLQYVRIMNRACEIAWSVLTQNLSRGVRKNPKKDPNTGAITIFEPDAALIESQVNDAEFQPLKGQVTDVRFSLSRTDDLSANAPVVNGVVSVVALAYIKGFAVQAQFSKTISVAT